MNLNDFRIWFLNPQKPFVVSFQDLQDDENVDFVLFLKKNFSDYFEFTVDEDTGSVIISIQKTCRTCSYRRDDDCVKAGYSCKIQRKHPDSFCDRNYSGYSPKFNYFPLLGKSFKIKMFLFKLRRFLFCKSRKDIKNDGNVVPRNKTINTVVSDFLSSIKNWFYT